MAISNAPTIRSFVAVTEAADGDGWTAEIGAETVRFPSAAAAELELRLRDRAACEATGHPVSTVVSWTYRTPTGAAAVRAITGR